MAVTRYVVVASTYLALRTLSVPKVAAILHILLVSIVVDCLPLFVSVDDDIRGGTVTLLRIGDDDCGNDICIDRSRLLDPQWGTAVLSVARASHLRVALSKHGSR